MIIYLILFLGLVVWIGVLIIIRPDSLRLKATEVASMTYDFLNSNMVNSDSCPGWKKLWFLRVLLKSSIFFGFSLKPELIPMIIFTLSIWVTEFLSVL